MAQLSRDRQRAASRPLRPAVVEHLGSPQPTSDGRATRPVESAPPTAATILSPTANALSRTVIAPAGVAAETVSTAP